MNNSRSTDHDEFEEFIYRLLNPEQAPEGYTPWLIPCKKDGKDPDTSISWKARQSRLTPAEAKRRLKHNWGNVGIAGRPDDALILLDIDDPAIEDEIKDTMIIRSRSRTGTHAIYWAHPDDEKLPCNIPTEKGELRSSDQYVVAPGSYVPCTEEELTEKAENGEITEAEKQLVLNDPNRGYYTLDNDKEIAQIKFEELPEVFRQQYQSKEDEEEWEEERYEPGQIDTNSNHSALFDLEVSDLTGRGFTGRDPHPLHPSDTGANWCIKGGLGHCWRHLVSLNAIQFLCVEAGYLSCLEAGSPHHNSNAGSSRVRGDDQAIWIAWKHAKEHGYIPQDDPIPARAMKHIAKKHDVAQFDDNGLLTTKSYNKVIEIVEEKY